MNGLVTFICPAFDEKYPYFLGKSGQVFIKDETLCLD